MIPIALAADAKFFPGLLMAVYSIARHTESSPVAFHVIDGGIHAHQRRELTEFVASRRPDCRIVFHEIDASIFEGFWLMDGSSTVYARLLLPRLLPDFDEVIYGDVDIYFGVDLSELWAVRLSGCSAAVVRDRLQWILGNACPWIEQASPDFTAPYFSSGLMKLNLAYWREHHVTETALEMARRDPGKYRFYDQCILNLILKNTVHWIAPRFNFQLFASDAIESGDEDCEGKNLHYINKSKPWLAYSRRKSYRFWRKRYRQLISRWPSYMMTSRYWARYFWVDWIVMGSLIKPVCRLLLATKLHHVLPDLNEDKLRGHLGA